MSNSIEGVEKPFDGTAAILGMDIVSFSTLHDEDQIVAVGRMLRWIREALLFHSLSQKDYRWSPAGDGGFLSFITSHAMARAIDVAFSILEKIQRPDWVPRSGKPISIRMALHLGHVKEAKELGRETNIWGLGINKTARILSVTCSKQLLVSKQYYDQYILGQRENQFEISRKHWWRTVKHGDSVEVMNLNLNNYCLESEQAFSRRWQDIGGLWKKTVKEYTFLMHDTMKTGDTIAAIAAAKFLLDLKENKPIWELCSKIGKTNQEIEKDVPQAHFLFSQMPPDVLFKIIESIKPRIVKKSEIICKAGEKAISCYFPVSGEMVVDLLNLDPIKIPTGNIVGEFSLWIPNLKRTATIKMNDEGLILEIDIFRFKEIMSNVPKIEDSIYRIVKDRIIANTPESVAYLLLNEILVHR